ncbi:hypothetical protein PVAP13_2NG257200 [Panicum virgatum]|uniref:Uncharacterized protein n=1 Tax=Panicum virgatum TaxID=38727 RepID=A0A8T0VBY9_PANVG|nr:hypothetical protein PVAP13_2NG257200 [Panicum virgatum]
METMREEAVADGQPPLPSVEVVSKVLSQNNSNSMFLKNASISTPSSKSPLSAAEVALHQELDAEKQGSVKKNEATKEALERIARQYEELKKLQEESNLILRTL